MSVKLNELALKRLLLDQTGPIARDLARRADNVLQQANQNVSGLPVGVRSGDLRAGLRAFIETDADGLKAVISTDAASSWKGEPFSYPAFLDAGLPPYTKESGGTGTHPWLTPALDAAKD